MKKLDLRTLEGLRIPEGCLSELALDRLWARELAAPVETEARAHLAACPACATRLGERDEAAAALEGNELLAARMRREIKRSGGGWRVRAGALALVAAAATAFLTLAPRGSSQDAESGIRTKGGLALEIIARHADGRTSPVVSGEALRPGDAIRFRVSHEGPGYLWIAGLDAAQAVTVYHPVDGAPALSQGAKAMLLDGSIVLDDTRGEERIMAVLCDRPVGKDLLVEKARVALARSGGDPGRVTGLDLDCRQTSLVIDKEVP